MSGREPASECAHDMYVIISGMYARSEIQEKCFQKLVTIFIYALVMGFALRSLHWLNIRTVSGWLHLWPLVFFSCF